MSNELARELLDIYDTAIASSDQKFQNFVASLELDPENDLRTLNLSQENLQDEDFSWLNMERASFIGSSLEGACFRGTYLAGADFTNADLRGADFREAILEEAKFAGSQLQGANFWSAVLLERSIEDATWRYVYWDKEWRSKSPYSGLEDERVRSPDHVFFQTLEGLWQGRRKLKSQEDIDLVGKRLNGMKSAARKDCWLDGFRSECLSEYYSRANQHELALLHASYAFELYSFELDKRSKDRIESTLRYLKDMITDVRRIHLTLSNFEKAQLTPIENVIVEKIGTDNSKTCVEIINENLGRVEISLSKKNAELLLSLYRKNDPFFERNNITHLEFIGLGIDYSILVENLTDIMQRNFTTPLVNEKIQSLPSHLSTPRSKALALVIEAEEDGDTSSQKQIWSLVAEIEDVAQRHSLSHRTSYVESIPKIENPNISRTITSNAGIGQRFIQSLQLSKVALAYLVGLFVAAVGSSLLLILGLVLSNIGSEMASALSGILLIAPLTILLGGWVGGVVGSIADHHRGDSLAIGAASVFLIGGNFLPWFVIFGALYAFGAMDVRMALQLALDITSTMLVGLLKSFLSEPSISSASQLMGIGFGAANAYQRAR